MLHAHHSALHLSSLAPLTSPVRNRPSPIFPFHSPLVFISLRQSPLAAVFRPWLAELPEFFPPSPIGETEGPVEILSSSSSSLFAINDSLTPLQTATSVLLTGAITVFLFRSLRRRAKRAKELRVRSTGTTNVKGITEEAFESLKTIGVGPGEAKSPPSPIQALLGGITAGVIAVILYKFTTIVEASLNRQTISDNFSVRQLTITIRTIVNGLCYLATFVFGINSIGLILYSIQLAFSSVMEGTSNNSSSINIEGENTDFMDPSKTSTDEADSKDKGMSESSDEA
ncbi:uncharacterized protein LOC110038479 [Phalaenopsis equestris]|uniref:uncharacterized protein LOC110038479 n=1 Tax=Phalaenopsis equestris TaxID=78828 RepID=UPI0009E46F3B|nr:uncharacterized protein LOC110038479 [Phalaenopsis equestris]XP_020598993.1 uncharacterized protein LOC110038479 [Phalaenopsis equestris]XP_020598994.1 uncharacterized protein LOC110038479 [Phalaenopsis equestris]XP_020598995.1 uncharacterized protein LOC110038479 [Phalaenopsis equestris]XP_020598996.1 uncharacterized protein LOC110038479 [Phalaenopsis equestris]